MRAGLIALGVVFVASAAHAGDVSRAQAAFEHGKKLFADGQIDEACRSFEASVREEPGIGARFKLAECHEKQGRFASAFAGFREVEKMARERKQGARERVARDRAAVLEKRVAHLVVIVEGDTPPGIEVLRDDEVVARGKWGVPLPVDQGTFIVRARAPGYVTWEQSLSIAHESSSNTVVVPPLVRTTSRESKAAVALAANDATAAPAASADVTVLAPRPSSLTGGRIGAMIAGGAGVAAIAGGSYLGIRALSNNSESRAHCFENECDARGVALRDRALSQASASTWLLAGGAALAVGSVVLWLVSPPQDTRKLQVGFSPNLRGAALTARATW